MLKWKNAESKEKPLEIDCTLSSTDVYLRKNIRQEEEMYKYDEVILSSEYRYPILDMNEYKEKLLNAFKEEYLKENEKILADKKTINTSLGEFSIKTPTYDFVFCLMAMKDLPQGISEGTIRLADGTPVKALTQAEVQALYMEFYNSIAELDKKFTSYKNQIIEAKNFDELENIEIIY